MVNFPSCLHDMNCTIHVHVLVHVHCSVLTLHVEVEGLSLGVSLEVIVAGVDVREPSLAMTESSDILWRTREYGGDVKKGLQLVMVNTQCIYIGFSSKVIIY